MGWFIDARHGPLFYFTCLAKTDNRIVRNLSDKSFIRFIHSNCHAILGERFLETPKFTWQNVNNCKYRTIFFCFTRQDLASLRRSTAGVSWRSKLQEIPFSSTRKPSKLCYKTLYIVYSLLYLTTHIVYFNTMNSNQAFCRNGHLRLKIPLRSVKCPSKRSSSMRNGWSLTTTHVNPRARFTYRARSTNSAARSPVRQTDVKITEYLYENVFTQLTIKLHDRTFNMVWYLCREDMRLE